MAKVELTPEERTKLKRLVNKCAEMASQQKLLAQEYEDLKEKVTAFMVRAKLDTVETDLAVASYVAGAEKRTINTGALVKKLKYAEFAQVARPVLKEVEKLLTADELAEVITTTTGEPYLTIRARE